MSGASKERKSRLGRGWLPSYVPAVHRPWHSQHPSIIGNENLLETCDRYESIFPNGDGAFEPKNMPWWTHWLVAFAVRNTTLDEREICLLYKYKYKNVIPDIDRLQVDHIVRDFWDYLRDGEHEYAFDWERSAAYEDALRDLLSAWLFEACRTESWQSEEERTRWLSFGCLNYDAVKGEARSDQVVGETRGPSGAVE